jgi:hypothetical protein
VHQRIATTHSSPSVYDGRTAGGRTRGPSASVAGAPRTTRTTVTSARHILSRQARARARLPNWVRRDDIVVMSRAVAAMLELMTSLSHAMMPMLQCAVSQRQQRHQPYTTARMRYYTCLSLSVIEENPMLSSVALTCKSTRWTIR